MEKKQLNEMKFMMERLESPRMTNTEYEKRHKKLIKESEEMEESWLGNLFGGKKESPKNTSTRKSTQTIDGVEVDAIFTCDGWSGNKVQFGKDSNGKKFAITSNSNANQNGYNTRGKACSTSEVGNI